MLIATNSGGRGLDECITVMMTVLRLFAVIKPMEFRRMFSIRRAAMYAILPGVICTVAGAMPVILSKCQYGSFHRHRKGRQVDNRFRWTITECAVALILKNSISGICALLMVSVTVATGIIHRCASNQSISESRRKMERKFFVQTSIVAFFKTVDTALTLAMSMWSLDYTITAIIFTLARYFNNNIDVMIFGGGNHTVQTSLAQLLCHQNTQTEIRRHIQSQSTSSYHRHEIPTITITDIADVDSENRDTM